jgi:serine/threonine protein phosphatase 1
LTQGIHFLDAKGPEGVRLYAIGDVHGRLDLLEKMHAAIKEDVGRHPDKGWRIIHLGDYVDRGRDSRGVLDFLVKALKDQRMAALAGNHDVGFFDFLKRPEKDGLFALYGGRETAQSYGVKADFSSQWLARQVAEELLAAMPNSHVELLTKLTFSVSFGDFFFCHAGIKPGVPLDEQKPHSLIWIRDEFLDWTGLHPKIVVHGHTPSPEPEVMANRVNVDTQAYASGVLSALVIDGREKTLMQVTE